MNVSQGVVPQTGDLARRIGSETHVLPLVGRMNFLNGLLNWSVRLQKINSEFPLRVNSFYSPLSISME